MKLYMFLLLLLPVLLFGQDYDDVETRNLYSDATIITVSTDSVKLNSTLGFYGVHTSASAADSGISVPIPNNGTNDKTVTVYCDSIAGTTNTEYLFGRYQGPEYGIEYQSIGSITSDGGTIKYNVGSASWASEEVVPVYYIKFKETGNQRNVHGVRVTELIP